MLKSGPGSVYFALDRENDRVKIGFTTKAVSERLYNLEITAGVKLELLREVKADYPAEQYLLYKWQGERIEGEWFRNTPEFVSYILSPAVVKDCKSRRRLTYKLEEQRRKLTEQINSILRRSAS